MNMSNLADIIGAIASIWIIGIYLTYIFFAEFVHKNPIIGASLVILWPLYLFVFVLKKVLYALVFIVFCISYGTVVGIYKLIKGDFVNLIKENNEKTSRNLKITFTNKKKRAI